MSYLTRVPSFVCSVGLNQRSPLPKLPTKGNVIGNEGNVIGNEGNAIGNEGNAIGNECDPWPYVT